jgi:hypothetical protein
MSLQQATRIELVFNLQTASCSASRFRSRCSAAPKKMIE